MNLLREKNQGHAKRSKATDGCKKIVVTSFWLKFQPFSSKHTLGSLGPSEEDRWAWTFSAVLSTQPVLSIFFRGSNHHWAWTHSRHRHPPSHASTSSSGAPTSGSLSS